MWRKRPSASQLIENNKTIMVSSNFHHRACAWKGRIRRSGIFNQLVDDYLQLGQGRTHV